MAKNTDSSIKLLVLYDILLKSTDEEHALSTNEIIEELKKRGISVSRKVLPSDIDLLNKYGYEICSYVKKARYYYAVHQLFDTAEITMLTDVIKASKLTDSRKETIINNTSIDDKDIQKDIVEIMEGGEEAFNRRKAIYQNWRLKNK